MKTLTLMLGHVGWGHCPEQDPGVDFQVVEEHGKELLASRVGRLLWTPLWDPGQLKNSADLERRELLSRLASADQLGCEHQQMARRWPEGAGASAFTPGVQKQKESPETT